MARIAYALPEKQALAISMFLLNNPAPQLDGRLMAAHKADRLPIEHIVCRIQIPDIALKILKYFPHVQNLRLIRSYVISALAIVIMLTCAGIAYTAPMVETPAVNENLENIQYEDSPYNALVDENNALKRQARLQGARMRSLYGPAAAYHGAFIEAEDEVGSRHTAGITMPLSEFWEGAILDHVSFFSMKNGNRSAGRESLDLRIGMNPGQNLRPWFMLTPYFNFEDADGSGLGVAAGMANSWRNGVSLELEGYALKPWDEGYSTIVEDGRKYGAAASFTLPFTKNFYLASRAFYEELELGEGAQSGAQYAGNRYVVNARAYYRLFHRDDAYMDYGFRSDDLWNEYLVGSEMGIFMHVDFQRYFKPDGFDAINPVPEVFAQEIGMSFQYAISPHLGVSGEGFIGRDPDRDLQFGELYGLHGRLVVVATPRLRIWAETSYLKTNTTLESSGGQETIISLGVNYAF